MHLISDLNWSIVNNLIILINLSVNTKPCISVRLSLIQTPQNSQSYVVTYLYPCRSIPGAR